MAKLLNDYAREIPHYDDIPKSVLGAIAMSFAVHITGEEDWEKAKKILVTEWSILAENEIVPQSVPSKLRHLIDLESRT